METALTKKSQDVELPRGNEELILVVDDEADICQTVKTLLITYGYRVLIAKDGIEAIATYVRHQQEIHVVLINWTMPSMNGETASRTLLKIAPKLKIIAASGLWEGDWIELAKEIGISAFLPKPYMTKDLLLTLHDLVTN